MDVTDSEDSKSNARKVLDEYSETSDYRNSDPYWSDLAIATAKPTPRPPSDEDHVDKMISMFRNVRIIYNMRRSPKVWCDIQAWVWYYNDHPRESRAGWCYVENVRTYRLIEKSTSDICY